MLNIRRENIFLKKGLHHFFEVVLPLRAVRFGFVLMLIPGMQVCKLMYSSYQESVNIQIIIDRDAVAFAIMWRTVITELAVPVAGNFKLTLKVIYPATNQRRGLWWKIPF